MKRTWKKLFLAVTAVTAVTFALTVAPSLPGTENISIVEAHRGSSHHSERAGRKDGYYYCGGHEAHTHDNDVCPYKDYYCGGHGAHQHTNGVCPYTDYYCEGHEAHRHTNGVCPYTDYYCDGHEAHRHENGICPYADPSGNARTSVTDTQPDAAYDAAVIKELQRGLSQAGYDCGKADGIWGRRSQAALKCYQEDHSMTGDGCMSREILEAFGITE